MQTGANSPRLSPRATANANASDLGGCPRDDLPKRVGPTGGRRSAPNPLQKPSEAPSKARLFTLLCTGSLGVLTGAVVTPALPQIAVAFEDTPNAAFWAKLVLTLPALTAAAVGPFGGWAIDRLGRRRILLLALSAYGLAGSLGLALSGVVPILLSRALLGVAGGIVIPTATTLVSDYYDGDARGRVLGYLGAFAGFSGFLILPAAGALAGVHWRAPFLLYLLPFVLLPIAYRELAEPAGRKQSAATAVGGAVAVSRLLIIYSLGLLSMATFYVVPVQLPFHLQDTIAIRPGEVGLFLALFNVAFAATAALYGRLQGNSGFSARFATGFALFGLGHASIGLGNSAPPILLGLALGGIGMGVLMPTLNSWAARGLPMHVRGRVLGGLTTSLYAGQFIAPLLSEPLTHWVGLSLTFISFGAAMVVVGLVFILRDSRIRRRVMAQPVEE